MLSSNQTTSSSGTQSKTLDDDAWTASWWKTSSLKSFTFMNDWSVWFGTFNVCILIHYYDAKFPYGNFRLFYMQNIQLCHQNDHWVSQLFLYNFIHIPNLCRCTQGQEYVSESEHYNQFEKVQLKHSFPSAKPTKTDRIAINTNKLISEYFLFQNKYSERTNRLNSSVLYISVVFMHYLYALPREFLCFFLSPSLNKLTWKI